MNVINLLKDIEITEHCEKVRYLQQLGKDPGNLKNISKEYRMCLIDLLVAISPFLPRPVAETRGQTTEICEHETKTEVLDYLPTLIMILGYMDFTRGHTGS
jgi:hypothetical protein